MCMLELANGISVLRRLEAHHGAIFDIRFAKWGRI